MTGCIRTEPRQMNKTKNRLNSKCNTNTDKNKNYITKMMNNVSTQNLYFKTIMCEVDTEYLSTRSLYLPMNFFSFYETFFDIPPISSPLCSDNGDVLQSLSSCYMFWNTELLGTCLSHMQVKLVYCD